ncbi:hypothetical protein PACILC2_40980 [Paenibacillus cisolokensis]|jgi:Transcriptional regulator|uniref:HTH tetR-type domain-containing protein n=1 Tax=Paenibacillus cisolokensis TaxID=1658519 RepID=A0ABQ4NBH9_9BACL|nr:TetR/AcrR family transcriptional regulator [Paenibacillus cisolokensis]GIQ65530.1 hypothetical protein PACILC2_40980 [Paenibacillus cisolokensis]
MSLKPDAAKIRILEAAKHCFAENGYNQTSVRQICEVADANLALVSYYYGSKEKLYFAVLDQWYLEASQHFSKNTNVQNPKEELEQFISTFLYMRKHDKQFHMLLRHELSSESPRKEFVSKLVKPYLERLRNILSAGKEKNVFHYESLELISKFIISILVYPAYDSFLLEAQDGQESAWEDEVRQTTNFIFAGLEIR